MKIRLAEESDLSAIVEIYNASIPGRMATADINTISLESRQNWFKDHQPNTYPLWVMENPSQHNTHIIGWLSVQSFYGRPAYHSTAEVSLYVHPQHQQKGIGKHLLQYAVEQTPQLGIKTLLAFIFAHNQPSLQLFEQLGFIEWGYLPGVAELDKIERDLIILGRRLVF